MGALTAGVMQSRRGDEFWPAFRTGALGGAITYAGRRLAAAEFDGAGILGRQLAAVGASVVRNASEDRSAFARLAFPVGIVRLHVEHETREHPSSDSTPLDFRAELDVPTLVAVLWFVTRDDAVLQLEESLSAGAPVFYTHDRGADGNWSGDQIAGVARIRGNPADPLPDFTRAEALGHERVHVLQYDFTSRVWGEAAERWLADRFAGAWLERHLDLGLQLAPWGLANLLIPYDFRPWEMEAGFVSGAESDAD